MRLPGRARPRGRATGALGVAARAGLLVLVLLGSWVPPADAKGLGEYEVKAAFLYQFTLYVTWPKEIEGHGTFGIGIVGDDPFDAALDRAVAGKTVQGLPVVVRRFRRAADVDSCQIVFLGRRDEPQAAALLERTRRRPVLTVGETRAFLDRGGILRFRLAENRVRFEMSPRAADDAGLKVSSRLYGVAEIVGR